MTWTGDIQFSIIDGLAGSVNVQANTVMAVVGCAGAGNVGQVYPIATLPTLASTFSSGPLMQAAGLIVQAGGVVLGVRATTATAGTINGSAQATTAITGVTIVSTNARIVYSAQTPHVLRTGDIVTIASVGGAVEVNGTFPITVIDTTHFEVPVSSITAYTSGGTVQYTGAAQSSLVNGVVGVPGGTSVMTITGTPTDDYYPVVRDITGCTIGVVGGVIAISLDAGRTFGPSIPLGTATSYALKDTGGLDTGLTVHFAAGTLVAGDQVVCSTTAPAWNDAGLVVAMAALQAYAAISGNYAPIIHFVGVSAGADATAIESSGSTNLDSLATAYQFERAIVSARDALPPVAWGGAGETDATWAASVLADFAAVSARRVGPGAGYYNLTAAFPTLFASTPIYRRPLAWAWAARQVTIVPQRHAGAVADERLPQVVVNPLTDPGDGFVYHNSALTPTLDYFLPGGAGRFTTARTHSGKQGYYISNPLSLAPVGSDFALFPYGLVMDIACGLTHGALLQFVNANLQTNANGTLSDKGAGSVRTAVNDAIRGNMSSVAMISGFTVAVDQTQNILVTKALIVTVTIQGVAYILQINVNIGYATSIAA